MNQYNKYESTKIKEWLIQYNEATDSSYELRDRLIHGDNFIFENVCVPYDFGDVNKFYTTKQEYNDELKLPRNVNNIKLNDIQRVTDLDLRNTFCKTLVTIMCSHSIKTIQNINCSNDVKIQLFDLPNLEKITFAKSMSAVFCCTIDKCNSIKSVSQIDSPLITDLSIDSEHFESFENSKIQKIYRMNCNCNGLLSFRDVDNLNIQDDIRLFSIRRSDNLINTMNIPSPATVNLRFCYSIIRLEDIMRRFLQLPNRREYMMDCVLELIENSYYSAAEL